MKTKADIVREVAHSREGARDEWKRFRRAAWSHHPVLKAVHKVREKPVRPTLVTLVASLAAAWWAGAGRTQT